MDELLQAPQHSAPEAGSPALNDEQREELKSKLQEGAETVEAQNQSDVTKLGEIAAGSKEYRGAPNGVVLTNKEYEHDVLGKAA